MLTRTFPAIGVVATMLVVITTGRASADPWGEVDCDQVPSPSCDLGAGEGDEDQDDGRPPIPDGPDEDGGNGTPDTPIRPPGDHIIGEPENLADCQYVPVDYVPPGEDQPPVIVAGASAGRANTTLVPADVVVPPDDQGGEDGAWYVYQCTGEGFTDAAWRPPVWIPHEQRPDGSTGPSVVEVAHRAYAQLHLTAPQISVSPAAEQLVRLPTWLWLDPDTWAPISATASVPGVSVTATAVPQSVSWAMGDGATVTCGGPGTPFASGTDPAAESPDCGHIYTAASERYDVTATVEWTVSWAGAGQSGVFPGLTTSTSTQVRVVESQTLTTN